MKKHRTIKTVSTFGIFFAISVLSVFFYNNADTEKAEEKEKRETIPKVSRPYNDAITKDTKEIFNDEQALYSYIKKYGPKETLNQLAALVPLYGSCHDTAHRAGRFAYELNDSEAFQLCSAECHSGCYHGATEAYFRDHGTKNLADNLQVLCNSELNNFFSHQCLHGIGHGLMAWTNYELSDALKSCDLLPRGQSSCWTGVFMENIVGTLGETEGHVTSYLSENPQFPCTIVTEQYKPSCYFLQTSRMMQLFAGDFKKIATACSEAPIVYQRICFESMGRDVGGVHRGNPAEAIRMCAYSPSGDMRIGCLIGAAQDSFWDPSGQDAALRFCSLLSQKNEKDACYNTIFVRATEVLPSRRERKLFCAKSEAEYRELCQSSIGRL